MKALILAFALVALLSQVAFASEAELSDIVRPVDAQAWEEVNTSGLGEAVTEEQRFEVLDDHFKEAI